MPFRNFSEPVDVARCHAALESAWADIKTSGLVLPGTDESEKLRLAVIIANRAGSGNLNSGRRWIFGLNAA